MDRGKALPSLFDIVGPVMTGPSSSHTAGAVRIGLMGRAVLAEEPRKVTIGFHGALSETYKGHFTDSGVVAGLLGMDVDDPRIPQALDLARQAGVQVQVNARPESTANPNTIDLELDGARGSVSVSAITAGGGEILVTRIGAFPVFLRGKVPVAILEGKDLSGAANEVFRAAGEIPVLLRAEDGSAQALLVEGDGLPGAAGRLAELEGVERVRLLPSLYDYALADPEPLFDSFRGFEAFAEANGISASGAAIAWESKRSGLDESGVRHRFTRIWRAMVQSVETGLASKNRLVGGFMPGDDGIRLWKAVEEGRTLSGDIVTKAVARSLAAMEVNGSLGCVVAAPTAGSCGVMPGALMSVAGARRLPEEEVVEALIAGAMVGVLVAARAPVSGALGGCQSEIGVASAMAASALVQLGGGSPEAVCHGAALALKNLLGLICDPVGGPVEIPCIKRNSVGVANAFAAADMAIAGIRSAIPPDEVVTALRNVQTLLPTELRGTMKGGLGVTETAARLKEEWLGRIRGWKN
ncbi:MAG: L-serine ammonia-lyase, iron-sulfur-dependent, subunit alpha [Synergistales bacterium]